MVPNFMYKYLLGGLLGLVSLVATAAAPFEDSMAQRTRACTACHGDQGRAGPDGYYPRLAGKPAGYLYQQLLNLREGRRHYALMQGLLEPLTDAYLLEMARYFSALNVPYPAPAPAVAPAAVLARGQALVTLGDASRKIPPCQQCHGTALTGTAPHVPGLLGLPRDYLNAQLGGWRTHQRRAAPPDCMADIAAALSEGDVTALSHWLAAQPVPANHSPATAFPPRPPGAKPVRCAGAPEPLRSTVPVSQPTAQSALVTQGAYLARVGNCAACHTTPGGAGYAGQRGIETPFGTVYSSNLTPDRATGLGTWTADDFWQAMHHGRSKDGRLLNPAFPYTRFTRMGRADSDALWAYLQTLPPVPQPNTAHALRWPFGTQGALWAWRTLYFSPQSYQPQASHTAQWNRGAYLVTGLGHCGECHAPRNALGASTGGGQLTGGTLPGQGWVAPSLQDATQAGVPSGALDATVQLLKTGLAPHGQASGPMAQVVQGSTQYLNGADLQAMGVYLQSLGADTAKAAPPPTPRTSPSPTAKPERSAQLYEKHCADCHGLQGAGVAGAYPPLANNRAVNLANSANLIQTVLYGGFAPATQGNPRPFGMPPFVLHISDQDSADLLTFIRSAWGNQGAPVTVQEVTRVRDRVQR